jgi:hypothetical protein
VRKPYLALRKCSSTDGNRRYQVEVSRIIAEIDAQISKLQQARSLLAGTTSAVRTGPGRPKAARKRKLSPEGRKRIADAMKKRWADRRKQVAKG